MHKLSPVTETSFLNQRKEKQSTWPDWVPNPGPLALELDVLPNVPRRPAIFAKSILVNSANAIQESKVRGPKLVL